MSEITCIRRVEIKDGNKFSLPSDLAEKIVYEGINGLDVNWYYRSEIDVYCLGNDELKESELTLKAEASVENDRRIKLRKRGISDDIAEKWRNQDTIWLKPIEDDGKWLLEIYTGDELDWETSESADNPPQHTDVGPEETPTDPERHTDVEPTTNVSMPDADSTGVGGVTGERGDEPSESQTFAMSTPDSRPESSSRDKSAIQPWQSMHRTRCRTRRCAHTSKDEDDSTGDTTDIEAPF